MDDEPRQVLARLGFELDEFSAHDITHNHWLTPGIWELSSPQGHFILKRLAPRRDRSDNEWGAHWFAGLDEPRRWNYWAREGLAYTSGLVDVYESGGIAAPRLVASSQCEDEIVLLLEFVDGEPAEHWGVASYAAAATALGRAQGRLAVEQAAPTFPWLSQGFLRQYSSEKPVDWTLLTDDSAWDQPLVRQNFPPKLREATTWLHESRDRLYVITEALPRTICHLDFWTKNLVQREDERVVLFDWAFVGDGALGEDIGNLVPSAAFDHFVSAESLPDLAAAVLSGYLDGLAAAGWEGDPRLVELGMCAAAVKYDWLTPWMLTAASAKQQLRYGGTEPIDADVRFRERGLALLHNARAARRAIALAEELGV